jgi:hypothetical protein
MYKLGLVLLLSSGLVATAQISPVERSPIDVRLIRPLDRIRTRIDDRRTVVRAGNRHPLTLPRYDKGPAPPTSAWSE